MHPDISIGSTWISMCHWFELQRGWTNDRDASIAAVKKWGSIAIGMDDADGQAHTALCHVHLMEREFDQALEIGENAIAVRPSCANANGFFAHALYYCGLLDRAIHHARMAIRFSPAYPPLFAVVLSGALHAQGDHEAAVPIAKEMMRLAGRDPLPRVILTSALMEVDRQLEAHTLALEMREFDGQFEIDPFLALMPFRRDDMREQLSHNFTRALDDTT
jgi:tetratricopeptide (TPR) repeat protein